MTDARSYPETTADAFPEPPQTIVDGAGRSIEIRRAVEADVDGLVEMYRTFDPADRAQGIPPRVGSEIRSWLGRILGTGLDVVACHGERIVGHATLVPESAPDPADGVAGLGADAAAVPAEGGSGPMELAIFVHQDCQNAGIGTALIRALLGAAAADGIERIWLTVERWNRPAIRLYESVGFEPSEEDTFELEMTLRLA